MQTRLTTIAVMTATFMVGGGGGLAMASSPSVAQKRAFPALGGTPTRAVPVAVSRFIASSTGREAGVDPQHVYRLPAPAGGSWSVLPGDDAICVVFENKESISSCASPAQVISGDLKVLLISPERGPRADGTPTSPTVGPVTQVGLAPAGVAAVTARMASGESAAAQLSPAGLYEVRSEEPVTAITLHRATKGDLVLRTRWGARQHKPERASVFAHAASSAYYFCGGYCYVSGSLYSPLLPINLEQLSSGDGNWICGNLINTDGSWAGTTFCTTTLSPATGHPYNGSSRYGWEGPGVAGVTVIAQGVVWY